MNNFLKKLCYVLDKTQIHTLQLGDGHRTSLRYPLTKELSSLYMNLLNSCPISLQVHTFEQYKKQFISKDIAIKELPSFHISGQYVCGEYVPNWPKHFIFLESRPNPHDLMATYFHELGHYNCNTWKCYHCEKEGLDSGDERHAIMNELKSAMKHNLPEVMKASFEKYDDWLACWKNYEECQEYADAVLSLQSSKLWHKVKRFANKHRFYVPTFKKPIEHRKFKLAEKIKGIRGFLSNALVS